MYRPVSNLAGVVAATILLLTAAPAYAITAVEIVEQMEANEQFETTRESGTFEISDRFGTRTKTFRSMSRGDSLSLIEFTNPEEAGQKILRRGSDIYLYFPEAEDVIRLQGAALRENVLGSDLSYEDMTETGSLLDRYEVALEGIETIDGFPTYKVRMTAKTRSVAYPVQVMWVDTAELVPRRVEQFTSRGRALKQISITDYRQIDGGLVASRMVISDLVKKDSRTVFTVDSFEANVHLDESLFSIEELTF